MKGKNEMKGKSEIIYLKCLNKEKLRFLRNVFFADVHEI